MTRSDNTLAAGIPAMLDPDREEARQLLLDELSRGQYRLEPTLVERLRAWLVSLFEGGVRGEVPAAIFAIGGAIIVLLIVAAILWGLRGRSALKAEVNADAASVLGDERLSAAQYRARAATAASQQDYAQAMLDAFRALTAQADEDTLLDHAVALTAAEVAQSLQRPYPQHGQAIVAASHIFDRTRYGEISPSARDAQRTLELDDQLRTARPQLLSTP